jgi:hypothetical protein
VDIVIGTESWLDPSIKDHEVFPSGFTIYRKDRNCGKGGGVFIAVSDDIMSSHMADLDSDCEILWVKVDIVACKSLYIAAYYRPNAHDQESLNNLAASLDKLPKKVKHVWVGGDMNLPGMDWPAGTLKNNCPTPGQHNQFVQILADYGLSQMTDQPTRGNNILDLFAINNPTLLNRLEVIPGISDHDIVFAELDILPKRNKQVKRKILLYGKANWQKIEEAMRTTHVNITGMIEHASVEDLWTTFKDDLLSAIDDHVPHRMSSTRDRPPWITTKVKKMIKSRNHLYQKQKANPTESKKEKLRKLKKQISKDTIVAYWNYTESILNDSENNSNNKKLWTFINHKKTDNGHCSSERIWTIKTRA